nr:hypothetical protein [Tanacetum cinerariifolium]
MEGAAIRKHQERVKGCFDRDNGVEWMGYSEGHDSPYMKRFGYSDNDKGDDSPRMEWVRESPCRVGSSLPPTPIEWVGDSPCRVRSSLNPTPIEWVGDSPCRVRSSLNPTPIEWVGDSPCRVRSSSSLPPMEWVGDSPCGGDVSPDSPLIVDDSPPMKQLESIGCSTNDGEPGVSEDGLVGQLPGAPEKVQYFGTPASADDKQALQRAKNLFPGAFA